jgi:multimeric flavodoxin WrbA
VKLKKIIFINGSPKRNGSTDELLTLLISYINQEILDCQIINLSDCNINYCTGCTTCYETTECCQKDDVQKIVYAIDKADIIVTISPSYWADITGQLKVFIDRLTPYCDTQEPYATLSKGKKGFAIALRTGNNPSECIHIVESINHFYGHLKIDFEDNYNMFLCGINRGTDDVSRHKDKIKQFADLINGVANIL